jgi:3-phenylpropionate/cinnamic acid dioxygenase small subunit
LTQPKNSRNHATVTDISGVEARLRILEDRQEILQSLVDYGELLDARDLDAWAELWAEDGEFEMSTGRVARGRERIKEMLGAVMAKSEQRVVHLEVNPRISLDGDRATSTMLYGVGRTEPDGLTRVVWFGHHYSRHVRTPAGWKIAHRRNTVDLPETGHP